MSGSRARSRSRARTLLAPAAVVVSVVLAATSCSDSGGDGDDGGSKDGKGGKGGKDAIKTAIIVSGPTNDLAWNQKMIESAKKLEGEGLIDLTVVQQGYSASSQEIVQAASDLAEDGNELIVAHSFNYGKPLKTMIDDYPDVLFAYAAGFGDNKANLADYNQPFYEGAFLTGILAGGVTKTGVLGGTAGFDVPVCHSMIEAFAEGAKLSYKGDAKLTMKPSYIGGWNDAAAQTKEAVIALTEQDADTFVTCGVDAATIEAAKETKTYAIGYVMDQSPLAEENVLASIVWNLDKVLRGMVADVRADRIKPAKYYEVGYKDGGIGVTINPGLKDKIPADTLAVFEDYKKRMADGDFKVPYTPK